MKIALCDDDKDDLFCISSILDTYKKERKVSMHYDVFHSSFEILSIAKSGAYDLYLLDIIMPGVNGMETAKEIRNFDQDASIVFLTSTPEFAVESYQYHAENYLLKPTKAEKLYALLDKLFAKKQNPQESFLVKTKGGIIRILFGNLVFIEVRGKCLYFHLLDGSVCEMTAPLGKFEDFLLVRPEFVRTHRSYIVNLLQVTQLTAREAVTLTGDKVPVSRKNYTKVQEHYVEQLFAKRETE
ncbi:MAG: LytTR family DNA-binding domain-containing protein [Lachnospiraceae bacterium]